jgi:hypothetical protein
MKLSFQEKSIWISLVTTILIFGFYFTQAIRAFDSPDVHGTYLIGLFIGIIILVVIVQIVLQSVLAIAHRKAAEAGTDERDNLIELRATRISYFVLVFGVWATCTSMLIHRSPLVMANTILFFFILSETVGFTSQLFYYRRGL